MDVYITSLNTCFVYKILLQIGVLKIERTTNSRACGIYINIMYRTLTIIINYNFLGIHNTVQRNDFKKLRELVPVLQVCLSMPRYIYHVLMYVNYFEQDHFI